MKKPDILINQQITSEFVKLKVDTGIEIVKTSDAIEKAMEENKHLIQISKPDKDGYVICIIQEYGKFMYEIKNKTKKQNNTKQNRVKEIKVGPKIGDQDRDHRLKQINEFLKDKIKVQFSLELSKREQRDEKVVQMGYDLVETMKKMITVPYKTVAQGEQPIKKFNRKVVSILLVPCEK